VVGAEAIWMAVLGPDTPPAGDVTKTPFTQAQVATTLAALLGEDWRSVKPGIAGVVSGTIGPRQR
jgi:hypothetical protein